MRKDFLAKIDSAVGLQVLLDHFMQGFPTNTAASSSQHQNEHEIPPLLKRARALWLQCQQSPMHRDEQGRGRA